MPDKDGYPTIEELKKIEKWELVNYPNDIEELVMFVCDCLWHPEDSFKFVKWNEIRCKKLNCIHWTLELHTLGWSGNEDIVEALNKNLFWILFWKKSERGGHFYFDIEMSLKKDEVKGI